MCLSALAIGLSPQRPLLLASNRDEYFRRPTLPLQRWTSAGGELIISGRDLEAGGTWLGLSAAGRLALLTNVREPALSQGARSRGDLPMAWLESRLQAPCFLDTLDPDDYSGFNLLIGDLSGGRWHWASNRRLEGARVVPGWQVQPLPPGVYGLSNAFLDTPWPKTIRLKQAMREALALDDPAPLLWRALADATPATEGELPHTGVSLAVERQLSSAFVRFPDGRYGTRASTVMQALATPEGWRLRVQEKSWGPEGPEGFVQEEVRWPATATLSA